MREGKQKNGLRVWTPVDANDVGLLRIADGAKFGGTTFPSGWKSPEGLQVARDGKLYEQPADQKT